MLELGFQYGDEDLEETQSYKIGDSLINAIVNEINLDENMPYNLRICNPALSETQLNKKNFYTYVKPPKCLKILTPNISEYGDLLLSKEANLMIEYLEKTSLEDIPEIYQRLIVLTLALRMARAVGKVKAIETVYPMLVQEHDRLYFTESLQADIGNDEELNFD